MSAKDDSPDPRTDPPGKAPENQPENQPENVTPEDESNDKAGPEPRLAREREPESGDTKAEGKRAKNADDSASPDSRLIGSLAEQYRVIGELRASPAGETRRFVAVRNDDHEEVMIDVVKASGGEGNELSHLAADVQARSLMSHPKVPPILEGRWLDSNTYACVSQRIKGDTLQERLDRGDRPGTAEVATVLNDVKAVLDWARQGGIIHRGVTPDSIVIEQDTNRMLISLGLTPLPMAGLPGELADTRTIAALAWSLFTGRRFVDDDTRQPLGELCPNLATRVADATERILRARSSDRVPDAGAFIGIVAVGDVLKQAEVEFAALDEEFASHFTGDPTRPPSEPLERLLTNRSPGARESILALGTIAALVLMIALGVGLAGRGHRAAPIVAQRMPTVPSAGSVDSGGAPMRNDSILTHSAAGVVDSSALHRGAVNPRDSILRDSMLRDSLLRDSITRDRLGRARRVRDSLERDSLDRDNARRDSLDEDAYRRDSVRNAIRAAARRDSVRRDSIQRVLTRSDSARIDSLRNDAMRQDSIRRETARQDSVRRDSSRRDSVRPDTITRRPDSGRPDSTRRDSIATPPPGAPRRPPG